jgi:hypothetical protein
MAEYEMKEERQPRTGDEFDVTGLNRDTSRFFPEKQGSVPVFQGAGAIAGTIGPRVTLLLGAACCLVGAALFAKNLPHIRVKVRPIYVRMGIIKEVAEGMETAAEQPPMPDASK